LAGAQLSRAQKKLQNGFFKIVIGPLGSELWIFEVQLPHTCDDSESQNCWWTKHKKAAFFSSFPVAHILL
jgi:hypothetical protein